MGFFKSKEEKQAIKDTRKAHKDAGRQGFMFIEHIGGHPKLSEKSNIGIGQGLEKNTLRLNDNLVTVTGLEWGEQSSRSVGKAAAGAIVGGALTGGLGLIAGAALGGRKADNSTAVMTCTDGVVEYTVYLRADAEKYQKLASLL